MIFSKHKKVTAKKTKGTGQKSPGLTCDIKKPKKQSVGKPSPPKMTLASRTRKNNSYPHAAIPTGACLQTPAPENKSIPLNLLIVCPPCFSVAGFLSLYLYQKQSFY